MQLVDLPPLIPDALIDLRYTTARNLFGRPLKGAVTTAQLDEPVARALAQAAEGFRRQNLRLVIWDAFRPKALQEQLKRAYPDRKYVREESNHCKGHAVDVTLATSGGVHLDMGTDHDDFSPLAHPDATGLTRQQVSNRSLLEDGMEQVGFAVWPYEWWHFDYVGH